MNLRKFVFALAVISFSTGFFFSCGSDSSSSSSHGAVTGIDFAAVSVPSTDAERTSVRISPSVTVTYEDGTVQTYDLTWNVLAKSGDTIGSNMYGEAVDKDGNAIDALLDGSADYSNNPDGMSIFKVGDDYHLITQFEDRPGYLYNTKMSLGSDGLFTAVSTEPVNPSELAAIGGTHTNCASSITPWGTHLAPEEDYDMDGLAFSTNTTAIAVTTNSANQYDDSGTLRYKHIDYCDTANVNPWLCTTVQGQMNYMDVSNYSDINPYLYGYNFEVSLDSSGTASIVGGEKHYTFGKYTPENAVVLPDQKTVIISDDGGFRGIYKFVAATAGDLTSGTLYAMQLDDDLSDSDTSAAITWIELGTGSNDEIKKIIDLKPDWSDMWEVQDVTSLGDCTDAGYKYVAAGDYVTCVAPRDGSVAGVTVSAKFEDAAQAQMALAFLEARRYAGYLGATMEWNKGEAVAYDKDNNVVWIGITDIKGSMLDDTGAGTYPYSGTERIKWSVRNRCGGVFKMALDSNYSPTSIELEIQGINQVNDCHNAGISGPDNVRYIGYDTLLIGEDTSGHENNMAWAYNTKKQTLTRILTGPLKSEITGMFADVNAGGNYYIFTGIQHPDSSGGWSSAESKKGITGYISGMPALDFTTY
jgi:secreted PhoX family phosphatase